MNPRGNDPRSEHTFPCSWFDKVGNCPTVPDTEGCSANICQVDRNFIILVVQCGKLEHTGWGRVGAGRGGDPAPSG